MKDKIVSITLNKGVTVSLAHYEFLRVDAKVEFRDEEGVDIEKAKETGYKIIDSILNEQIEEMKEAISVNSVFKIVKETKPETKVKETKPKSTRKRSKK